MTAPEIRPATDEEIAALVRSHETCKPEFCTYYDQGDPCSEASLVARIRQLELEKDGVLQHYNDICKVNDSLRDAAQERDRQIAVLEQERDDDTALIRRLNATAAAQAEKIERLKKREAGLEDALRQFRKVLGPFATKSALALLDAALDAALKPESKE